MNTRMRREGEIVHIKKEDMKGKETNKFHSYARSGKTLEKYFGKKVYARY